MILKMAIHCEYVGPARSTITISTFSTITIATTIFVVRDRKPAGTSQGLVIMDYVML